MAKRSKTNYYGFDPDELFNKFKHIYLNKYYNVFFNSVKWNNLTKEESDYVMRQFWAKGTLAAFDMKNVGLTFAPYAVSGYGLYDVPTTLNIINTRNVTGFPKGQLKNNIDVVIGYVQKNHKSVYEFVDFYCTRLAQVEMIINTNEQVQKLPYLIGLSDADKTNGESIITKILNNEVVVFANLEELAQVKVLANNSNYIIDKLWAHKQNLENELLTYLGINSDPTNMNRMTVDQVNANNQLIETYADGYITCLTEFCDAVRNILGYDISVEPKFKPIESVHDEKKEVEVEENV